MAWETEEQLQVRTCDHNSRRERLDRHESHARRRAFREALDWFNEHGDQYTADQAAEAAEACKCAILGTIGLIVVEAILSELVQIWVEHWMRKRGW